MRRAQIAGLALAASLAGCSVDVEGARCGVVGATEGCPSGQSCGTGLTCSARAAACAPCLAGVTACRAGVIDVMECTADGDPACGAWKVAAGGSCIAGSQTCQVPVGGGDPACVYLEGASCTTAGATSGCPPGQACGTGLTCSVQAASCSPCVAGATTCQAGVKDVMECTADVDPACGSWKVAAGGACGTGQTCLDPVGGAPACGYPEGATCSVAGSTAGCPPGQACGTGLTCSARATTCTPCLAGATACQAGVKDVMACTAEVDPACGTWKVAAGGSCAAGLQTCMIPQAGGAPACACLRHVVDAGGATCTHVSITSAIAAALVFPAPVVALGGATSYGGAADDAAPIVVPAGVTLVGDEAATAAATNRIIVLHGPGPEGLQVHPGAVVRGVSVERGDPAGPTGAPTVGVLLTGGAAAAGNTLVSVRVDGGGAGGGFAVGLRVAGANAVAVGDVLVRGATSAGLEVNRLGATDVVVVSASTFDQDQVGVSLLKGDLTLQGTTVKRSVAEGVSSATGVTGMTGLTIQDGVISWNGTAGLVLSANDKLVIQRTRVCANSGSDRTLSGQTRKVGGIFSLSNPPTLLTFVGNKIHDNGGDQVFIGASSSLWNLTGPVGCATSDRNVFAKYTSLGVGMAAIGATVSALYNSWGSSFPSSGTDYTAVSGSVDVGTGAGHSDFCLPADPADLVCPSP